MLGAHTECALKILLNRILAENKTQSQTQAHARARGETIKRKAAQITMTVSTVYDDDDYSIP